MKPRQGWLPLAALVLAACSGDATGSDVLVVSAVAVQPESVELPLRGQVQLEATPYTASGIEIPNREVSWLSRDPGIATVSDGGLVTALRPGRTEIVAQVDDVAGVVPVAVHLLPVAWVVVEPDRVSLKVGRSQQLEVLLFSLSGSPLTGRDVEFTSDDPSVAAVTHDGLVVAVRPGDTRVRARSEGKEGSSRISVNR